MLAVASSVPTSVTPNRVHSSCPTFRTPYLPYDSQNMLPSPPGTHSFAPPSPPAGDGLEELMEPSPMYSPLSSPSQSPKPPPSPPLVGLYDETEEYRMRRLKEARQQDLLAREKAAEEASRKIAQAAPATPSPAPLATPASMYRAPEAKMAVPSPTPTPTVSPANLISTPPAQTSATTTNNSNTSASASASTPTPMPTPTTADNSTDSIALRSTLRLLMLQRERAKSDIARLEEFRQLALKEPIQFVEYVNAQKSKRGTRDLKNNIFADRELPKPQEIYRCPPIEWSKYQVIGGPLDSMHERQRRRPSPSRPAVPLNMQTGGIIGFPGGEFMDAGMESGIMQGGMRLFDGIGCVGR